MENFVGEIRMFPYNNLPKGWYYCDGTMLTVNRETEKLFDYIKFTYGGNGNDKFALPDLRGTLALCANDIDPGRPQRKLNDSGGAMTNTLVEANLPTHSHTIRTRAGDTGNSSTVSGSVLGMMSDLVVDAQYAANKKGQLLRMDRNMLSPSIPTPVASFSIVQPVLGLLFAIAYQGIAPTRP